MSPDRRISDSFPLPPKSITDPLSQKETTEGFKSDIALPAKLISGVVVTDYEDAPKRVSEANEARLAAKDSGINVDMIPESKDDFTAQGTLNDTDGKVDANGAVELGDTEAHGFGEALASDPGTYLGQNAVGVHTETPHEAIEEDAEHSELDDNDLQEILNALQSRRAAAKRLAGIAHKEVAERTVADASLVAPRLELGSSHLGRTKREEYRARVNIKSPENESERITFLWDGMI